MKKEYHKVLLTIAGAVLFNIIFWQEKFALNAVIFDLFILWSVFKLYPAAFSKPSMKWLLFAHAVTIVTVLVHNTLLSKLAFSATLLLVVVFIQYAHRSAWYAAASAVTNYLAMVFSFIDELVVLQPRKQPYNNLGKRLRFLLIPLLIVAAFFVVYSLANVMFQNIVNKAGAAVQYFFEHFFYWFNWQRISFLLLGLFVTGGLLLKRKENAFSAWDMQKRDELVREKHKAGVWKRSILFDALSIFMGRFATGIMALKNENTVGVISLLLLNILLLIINCIDVVYVWFGFSYTPDINLTAYVHEGAGMLIFSIVLAMLVLLFFFRGNLNFYTKNKWLRYGAYAWIIQNGILAISVFARDGYYIQHMGLAYKRIGVVVFLLMVLMGLFTLFLKIQQQKSNYYLLKINGWFAIVLLVAASCIHWDEQIAAYNLARKNTIPVDVNFLLGLSDRTLPLLEKNKDVLEIPAGIHANRWIIIDGNPYPPAAVFELKKEAFFAHQKELSWLSWNWADEQVKKNLPQPVNNIIAQK